MPEEHVATHRRTLADDLKPLARPLIALMAMITISAMAVLNAATVIPTECIPWWYVGPAGGYCGLWSWERRQEKRREASSAAS